MNQRRLPAPATPPRPGSSARLPAVAVLMALSLACTACGAVSRARYYRPAPPAGGTPSRHWGDGLAFLSGGACVWIGEGHTKDSRHIVSGPIFLPVLPDPELLAGERQVEDYVEMLVWIVPPGAEGEYAFDPRPIRLRFAGGEEAAPRGVQISRFHTEPVRREESISGAEHWQSLPPGDVLTPPRLWAWNRFTFLFDKPAPAAEPEALVLAGLERGGEAVEPVELALVQTRTVRYVHSGQNRDGTWIGSSPADACRKLLAARGNS